MKIINKTIHIVSCMCAVAAVVGWTHGAHAKDGTSGDSSTVLVVVNGDSIMAQHVDREFMKTHRAQNDDVKATFDPKQVLKKLVNNALIIQEARAMGMDSEAWLVEELDEIRQKYATGYFIRDHYKPDLTVDPGTVEESFEKYYWKMQVRTVAVPTRDEAYAIRMTIDRGADMDSIAKAVSLDSKKFLGGLHSLKHWIDVPHILKDQTLDLKVGEMSQPFPYEDAFMVLRVEQRQEANPQELPMLEPSIRRALAIDLKEAAWKNFVTGLRVSYPIMVDDQMIQSIRADSLSLFRAEFMRGTSEEALSVEGAKPISEEALRKKISHVAMNNGEKAFNDVFTLAVGQMSEDLVLNAAASTRGYTDSIQVVSRMERVRDSMLIEAYLAENVGGQISFNRAEFQKYYEEHSDEYRLADKVQLKAMQFDSEAKALEAERDLNAGADFDFVYRRLARSGGVEHNENQWFTTDTYPEPIAERLDQIAVGQYTSPYRLTNGWVLFKLKARKAGRLQTMDEVDSKIRTVMFQKKFGEILDELLDRMTRESVIEYRDDAIHAYFGDEL